MIQVIKGMISSVLIMVFITKITRIPVQTKKEVHFKRHIINYIDGVPMKKSIFAFLFVFIHFSYSQWEPCNNEGFNQNTPYKLATYKEYIYAATHNGVFVSSDKGNNWLQKNKGLTDTNITVISATENLLFAGTYYNGIFVSTDNGNNWTQKNKGLNHLIINTLYIGENFVITGTVGGGIYLTTDNGENWTQKNKGFTDTNAISFFFLSDRCKYRIVLTPTLSTSGEGELNAL